MNPADTLSRHGIPSYPIRRNVWTLGADTRSPAADHGVKGRLRQSAGRYRVLFLFLRFLYSFLIKKPAALLAELRFLGKSWRLLRPLDVLVISGGGQFTESWGGPWGFPYTMFKWILMARLARVEPIVLNVGAGPLTLPLSKYFVRTALAQAVYVSFRDAQSARLAERIGFQGNKVVAHDLVYSLDWFPPPPVRNQRPETVGIAPMPWGKSDLYPDPDPFVYQFLLAAFGGFGSWLLANQYDVDLFGTDTGVDPPAIDDLRQTMQAENPDEAHRIGLPKTATTEKLFAAMSSLEYVVTCRFHGVVFAHILNKPVIALTHHQKVATLMSDIGMQNYCLDIRTVTADQLIDTFRTLVANTPEIKARMEACRMAYKTQVSTQFDGLFGSTAAATDSLSNHGIESAHIQRPGRAVVQ